jgi:hypothetical protein
MVRLPRLKDDICASGADAMPWFLVAIAFALCGCSSSRLVNLYPVQGPLAAQKPVPVIVGNAEGISGNTGTLTLALPSGELCSGKWSSVAAEVTSSSLLGRFGSTAGFPIRTGPLPGVNKGQAFFACAQGTSIEAEFLTGGDTGNGYGVARDTQGNIYKMLF